ncbi:MAG TPA: metal-dependent hydrolase, partial [Polyangiaceae bacterium]
LLVGEAAVRIREARSRGLPAGDGLRVATLLVSMLANNGPDIDSSFAGFLSRPLGSLLHHRGHTHTFVLSPVLAAAALVVTLAVARYRGERFDGSEKKWLFGVGLVGVVIHIALDATNNYGVHPFWPFYSGWFYGDSIFIVEPFLWAALVPPLVFAVEARWARISLGTVVLFGLGICWMREFVPRSMAVAVTLLAVATTLAARRATPSARVMVSAGAALAVGCAFAVSGAIARADVRTAAARDFPRARTHDIVMTPMPADPLCWQVVLVQTEDERYLARTGIVAILPSFMKSMDCPFDIWASPTAPSERVAAPPRSELLWVREFSAPLRELRSLARESCVFSALLRFARAPFWSTDPTLGRIAGDVRYDRSSGLDFSDTVLDGVGCPAQLPPWIPPTKPLLGDSSAR